MECIKMTKRGLLRRTVQEVMMKMADGLTVLELCNSLHQEVNAVGMGITLNEKGEFIDEEGRYSTASFIISGKKVVLTDRKNTNPKGFPMPNTYDASLASRGLISKDGLFKLDGVGNDAKIIAVHYLDKVYESNPHKTDAEKVEMDVYALQISEDDIDKIAAWAKESKKAVVVTREEAIEIMKGYDHDVTTETKGACLRDFLVEEMKND